MTQRLARLAIPLGLLAACGTTPPDELAQEVNRYYAAHASEENGSCQRPQIASVTERTAQEGDQVLVSYTYFQPGEQPTDWRRVFHEPVPCTGAGERRFTVEQTKLGLVVTSMTGPRRDVSGDE